MFETTILHCKAITGWGQLGLMRWMLVWILSQVQDWYFDLLTYSPVHCATTAPAPFTALCQLLILWPWSLLWMICFQTLIQNKSTESSNHKTSMTRNLTKKQGEPWYLQLLVSPIFRQIKRGKSPSSSLGTWCWLHYAGPTFWFGTFAAKKQKILRWFLLTWQYLELL